MAIVCGDRNRERVSVSTAAGDPEHYTRASFAPERLAPVRSAPETLAASRFALLRSIPRRSIPARFDPSRFLSSRIRASSSSRVANPSRSDS